MVSRLREGDLMAEEVVVFPVGAPPDARAFALVMFYEADNRATLDNIWVDKPLRGQGLFRPIWRQIIAECRRRGVQWLHSTPASADRTVGSLHIGAYHGVEAKLRFDEVVSFLVAMRFVELDDDTDDWIRGRYGLWALSL